MTNSSIVPYYARKYYRQRNFHIMYIDWKGAITLEREGNFKNAINDEKLKQQLIDSAITILIDYELLDLQNDLRKIIANFAYLLVNDNEIPFAMMKISIPQKYMWLRTKVFYFGVQDGECLLLDNDTFSEQTYQNISKEMRKRHTAIDWLAFPEDYSMITSKTT